MRLTPKKSVLELYKSRINLVFDYIEKNISEEFTLHKLSSVANFSKYHFHRIFLSMTGETPFHFISRVRTEKAAALLVNHPEKTVTEIATECGFYDSSIFARSFKARFKMSASTWRKEYSIKSNLGQTRGNNRQDKTIFSNYNRTIEFSNERRKKNDLICKISIQDLPDIHVAYIRYIGPFKGDSALFESLFKRLIRWGSPKGLMGCDTKSIIIAHDVPGITDEMKLRISVCITVPEKTKVDGEIGKMTIPGGKYAVFRFMLKSNEYSKAWSWVYGEWFPKSGYQPDDRPSFEMYPDENADGKTAVDICVPVIPI